MRSGPPTRAPESNSLAWLELKIPPVLLALIFVMMMWLVSLLLPGLPIAKPLSVVASAMIAGIGGFIAVSGVRSFGKARTTVNPTTPDQSSSLVTSGIYERTRNPMYVGLLLLLVGWGVFLSNVFSLALSAGFVLYMNRFQIQREEEALETIFGASYLAYKSRVRRWW